MRLVPASDPFDLQRFLDAQASVIDAAIAELHAGRKQTDWMWFVFPQLAGLGRSPTAQYYGIGSLAEAQAYLDHPQLGERLHRSVEAIMRWPRERSADDIFGPVDAMKLRSCLTLFDQVRARGLFARALDAFFDGMPDQQTLALLNGAR